MQPAFYSEKDLDALGLPSKMTRYRLRQKNQFPQNVRLSKGRVAYPAQAIDAWIKSKLETSQNAV